MCIDLELDIVVHGTVWIDIQPNSSSWCLQLKFITTWIVLAALSCLFVTSHLQCEKPGSYHLHRISSYSQQPPLLAT